QRVTRLAGAGLAAAALAIAGCGGGGSSSTPGSTSAPPTTAAPATTSSTGTGPKAHAPETPTTTSPEQQPGGAGDETPAHFDASLTGRGGSISPTHVSVGPYISVRVLLKSADGELYQ